MVEIIDNTVQFTAALVCCAVSMALYLRRRSRGQFLLTCFYGCFALGLLYWTLYMVLYDSTPATFYVSEIVWISSCVFLCLLQYTLAPEDERGRRCKAMYIAPASGAALFAVFFLAGGDVFSDILRCCVMSTLAWGAARGLAFVERKLFHVAVLCFVAAEYALWLSSIT